MTQYIDKAAIVAEIEKRRTNIKEYCVRKGHDRRFDAVPEQLAQILSFLDILEVKEADLEKEMDKEWNKCEPIDEGMGLEIASIDHEQFDNIAKHFYNLGKQDK